MQIGHKEGLDLGGGGGGGGLLSMMITRYARQRIEFAQRKDILTLCGWRDMVQRDAVTTGR